MQTYEVLLRPVISEKSTELSGQNKYTFAVSTRSNKIDIRRAVEDRFGVKVANVRIITMPAKEKGAGYVGMKKRRGLSSQWKKAIVTLAAGERMREDFFGDV
jgi:large subunit ribosomal protein L23